VVYYRIAILASIETAGFSDVDFKTLENERLVRRTVALVARMQRKGLIKSLSERLM
jgi:hypothetical protein